MKKTALFIVASLAATGAHAQIGINTTAPAATLDVQAKAGATVDGILIPRVDRQRAQNMTAIPTSTLIFVNSIANGAASGNAANIDAVGYYYYDGTEWVKISAGTQNIYNSNGALTADRTVDLAGKKLFFTGGAGTSFQIMGGITPGPILHVNATTARVGISTATPVKPFHAAGASQFSGEIFLGGSASSVGLPGTAGQVLTAAGTGLAPTWTTPAAVTNIYNTDGALAANRVVTMGANNLDFNGTGGVKINSTGGLTIADGTQGANKILVSDAAGKATWKSDSDVNTNIYNIDGTLLANRTVTMGANSLNFNGTGPVKINSTGGLTIADGTQGANKILVSDAAGKATWKNDSDVNTNIYNMDGTLSANRTVTQADKTLAFTGTAANAFSVDGQTLSVNAANHTVGLGTTTPQYKLDIRSASYGWQHSDGTVAIRSYIGQSAGWIGTSSAHGLWFMTGDTFKGGFDASGNFGIGTKTPQKKLHVAGELQLTNELNVGGDAATAGSAGTNGQLLSSQGPGAAPAWKNITDINTNIYTNDGTLSANRTVTQADKTLAFTGTATNAFSVDGSTFSVDAANNRVGIGTTAPLTPLDLGAALGRKISMYNNAAGTDFYGFGMAVNQLQFYTNANATKAAAMTLTNDNKLGIGTATPSTTLDLGPALGKKIAIYNNSTGTDFYGLGLAAATLQFFAAAQAGENPGMTLDDTGKLTIAGSLVQNSDIRLKKDIADNAYGLKEILSLRTINYRFKDEQMMGKDKKIGFIAQEVKAAMPELVSTANNEMKTLSVSYPEMTVVLTKAVQELQTVIQKQQEEINELKLLLKPKP